MGIPWRLTWIGFSTAGSSAMYNSDCCLRDIGEFSIVTGIVGMRLTSDNANGHRRGDGGRDGEGN